MNRTYSVDAWGSNPDEGNDDCWTGVDFDNLEEAQAFYEKAEGELDGAWFQLVENTLDADGRTLVEELAKRPNPDYKPEPDDDDDWRREIAMQAGMAGGCEAYNEVMGY